MGKKKKVVDGVHQYSADSYVIPDDPEVKKKLEWFMDQKLALMMHWGPYSQLGIVESWALSDKDAPWSRKCVDWNITGEDFKKEYFDLNRTFDPVRFEPDKWADIAAKSGIRYFVFTTKHHDGFCMWDTKFSDYKITADACPFHTNRYADICGCLFDSFRKKGIGIIPYFSKADWHTDSYWTDRTESGRHQYRGPSYDPAADPDMWERFVRFTQDQIMELGTRYGSIDGMWFDAGWVCSDNGQDIRLGEVIEKVRGVQPGMLCADRTVGGKYENYITPEQCVPEEPLNVPWESCITLGTSFSFAYEDSYKSPYEVIKLLTDIVAKGGNLALNVGPQPDGRLPQGAVRSLLGIGEWLNGFGEAIYGTRVCEPYKQDGIAFTCKDGDIYAIEIYKEEGAEIPDSVFVPQMTDIREVTMVDTNENVRFSAEENGLRLDTSGFNGGRNKIGRAFRMKK